MLPSLKKRKKSTLCSLKPKTEQFQVGFLGDQQKAAATRPSAGHASGGKTSAGSYRVGWGRRREGLRAQRRAVGPRLWRTDWLSGRLGSRGASFSPALCLAPSLGASGSQQAHEGRPQMTSRGLPGSDFLQPLVLEALDTLRTLADAAGRLADPETIPNPSLSPPPPPAASSSLPCGVKYISEGHSYLRHRIPENHQVKITVTTLTEHLLLHAKPSLAVHVSTPQLGDMDLHQIVLQTKTPGHTDSNLPNVTPMATSGAMV